MNRRSMMAALAAFILTFSILLAVGAVAMTDLRIGRLLFGDTYASVTTSEPITPSTDEGVARWLPARCRILLWLPQVVVRQVEKFLPNEL